MKGGMEGWRDGWAASKQASKKQASKQAVINDERSSSLTHTPDCCWSVWFRHCLLVFTWCRIPSSLSRP